MLEVVGLLRLFSLGRSGLCMPYEVIDLLEGAIWQTSKWRNLECDPFTPMADYVESTQQTDI